MDVGNLTEAQLKTKLAEAHSAVNLYNTDSRFQILWFAPSLKEVSEKSFKKLSKKLEDTVSLEEFKAIKVALKNTANPLAKSLSFGRKRLYHKIDYRSWAELERELRINEIFEI